MPLETFYFSVVLPVAGVMLHHSGAFKQCQHLAHVKLQEGKNVQLELTRTPLKPAATVTMPPQASKNEHGIFAGILDLQIL